MTRVFARPVKHPIFSSMSSDREAGDTSVPIVPLHATTGFFLYTSMSYKDGLPVTTAASLRAESKVAKISESIRRHRRYADAPITKSKLTV